MARDARDGPTDEVLLSQFLAGDAGAFEALVRRHAGELFQFVTRFVGASAAAEDIVQETFLQLHQSAGGFDRERRFKPWLFTIAANKARDVLRVRTRRREVSIDAAADRDEAGGQSIVDLLSDETEGPAAAVEREEQRRRVRAIVDELPDSLREILILGYYHRFAYKEIAEMLGIPLGTVKSRLHAAVARFAEAYRAAVPEQTD